jgi:hypothetical protein
MLLIVMAELCPFLSVTLWTELEVPTAWLPKAMLVGLTVTDCAQRGEDTKAAKQTITHACQIADRIIGIGIPQFVVI